jgi:hypothetical protein
LATTGRYMYKHTDLCEGFMKYAIEMGLGALIYSYIPSFIKIGSGFERLWGGTHTHTHR